MVSVDEKKSVLMFLSVRKNGRPIVFQRSKLVVARCQPVAIFLLFTLATNPDFLFAVMVSMNIFLDEFLIEKRGPLSIPPNVMELPKPKKNKKRQTSNKENIESKKSNLEKLILEEIKNN